MSLREKIQERIAEFRSLKGMVLFDSKIDELEWVLLELEKEEGLVKTADGHQVKGANGNEFTPVSIATKGCENCHCRNLPEIFHGDDGVCAGECHKVSSAPKEKWNGTDEEYQEAKQLGWDNSNPRNFGYGECYCGIVHDEKIPIVSMVGNMGYFEKFEADRVNENEPLPTRLDNHFRVEDEQQRIKREAIERGLRKEDETKTIMRKSKDGSRVAHPTSKLKEVSCEEKPKKKEKWCPTCAENYRCQNPWHDEDGGIDPVFSLEEMANLIDRATNHRTFLDYWDESKLPSTAADKAFVSMIRERPDLVLKIWNERKES